MKIETRIRQSRTYARTGTQLVAFLLAGALIAYLFGAPKLSLLIGAVALFFSLPTSIDYWNVARLEKKLDQDR